MDDAIKTLSVLGATTLLLFTGRIVLMGLVMSLNPFTYWDLLRTTLIFSSPWLVALWGAYHLRAWACVLLTILLAALFVGTVALIHQTRRSMLSAGGRPRMSPWESPLTAVILVAVILSPVIATTILLWRAWPALH